MSYKVTTSKEEGFEQLKRLVLAFEKQYDMFKTDAYSEAQLRIDFLNPLLKTYGWDVDNEQAKSQFLREVLQEETLDVEEVETVSKKYPDYTLRILGSRKMFFEAKKVSIDILNSDKPAFQTRRYGWNGKLGVSILSNFEHIIVYDCRYKPGPKDNSTVARYAVFHYKEFLNNFDSLYDLLSHQSIGSGYLDTYFDVNDKDVVTFDDYFLEQIESWRFKIASNIVAKNTGLKEEDINFLVQRLLNRIVFLRICEDREIEKYETLKSITSYDELKALFAQSDKKYNSGLFDFIEDNFSPNVSLDSNILVDIFNELYYPESPYNFSIIDPAILSQIYERYLGSKIVLVGNNKIEIVEEPEVAISSGVVPTPKYIVDNIVRETLSGLFEGKTIAEISQLRIADICCGSGTFLLSLYDFLSDKITSGLIGERQLSDEFIYQAFDGTYYLTLRAKQMFLLNNVYGVDINPYAVEVTKFSLFLKLLETENAASIDHYLAKYKTKVLPDLSSNIKNGNSLVDESYYKFNPNALKDDSILHKVKPFTWGDEFPFLNNTKGFDGIIGNPPYVRIQNLVKYIPEEIKFYQDRKFGYSVAFTDTFDKYYLFIQRAIQLINENGVVGYIVPNKFLIAKGGKALRKFITDNVSINKLIHFGVVQVFPNRSTYTAIIVLDKREREYFQFKRVSDVRSQVLTSMGYSNYESSQYSEAPWVFVGKDTESVFNRVFAASVIPLGSVAEITVGLQTSADDIYIFKPKSETETTYVFELDGSTFEVEKSICKPCIYDLSFKLFDSIEANAQMIFPYIVNNGKADLVSEDVFEKQYPLTWAYLNQFKARLAKRSLMGKKTKWYQFGRSQSLTKFHSSAKLVMPVLSTEASYIIDTQNVQFTGGGNGPYYGIIVSPDYSPYYIAAILSHPIFEAMVKSRASEFRGAYYSHGKQFIENLPIRKIDPANTADKQTHDEIAAVVEQIISTKNSFNAEYDNGKKAVHKRKLQFLYTQLGASVNSLYNITVEDVKTVISDEVLSSLGEEE